jgi:hypothetical protein
MWQKKNMKPLCDHPSYCKNDPKSVYIGQNQHIAYPPHRNQDSYFPKGWAELKGKFPDEFCAYSGPHGSAAKTLCTSGNSHAWQSISTSNREIMCAVAPPYKPDPPFSGALGSRNGANAGVYKFQKIKVERQSGNYDTIMVNECGKKGMKPLCDHPSYCKNDLKTVYIGQDQHMAYPPHRNTVSYFPAGWAELKEKFPSAFCAYTGPHGSAANTLCTSGGSHAWQNIGNSNREIMCAIAPPYKPDDPFEGVLDSRNGANAGVYQFQRLRAQTTDGNYDTIMVNACGKRGMKPLCDHPSYCRNDPKTVYIGQDNHISHMPHFNTVGYFPKGWAELKGKFPTTFCTYTGQHGGAAKNLCTTGGGHSWQTPHGNREMMCAKAPEYKPDLPFSGDLGSKNGANAGNYKFQKIRVEPQSGNYDTVMVNECAKKGMKPLCDHPSYCKMDPKAGYIGQDQHMAYPPHRNQDSYFPSGWSELKQKFPTEFCAYTGPHGSAANTLCTQGSSHAWKSISNSNRDVMCVKTPPYVPDDPFQGTLDSKNGQNAGVYKFQRLRVQSGNGNYDAIMVNECAKMKMKPLCDHPSYCRNDPKTVYIGQSNHISHMPHFNNVGYFPKGWAELKGKFPNAFCTYTGPHGSAAKSLCTTGGSHSWQTVTGNREIMCAVAPPYKPDPPFSGTLDSRNGANAGLYKFQKLRAEATSGNYDTIMVNECGKKGMKPLCDHPSYCKMDPKTVYIGQDQHMAYPPHRNTDSYFPKGWSELKQKFPGEFCAYTGPHGSAANTLCTSGSSHAWQNIQNSNRDIMCAEGPPYKPDPPFSGTLASRHGRNAGIYKFRRIRVQSGSGNYDNIMVSECGKYDMKPLCDHPSYCKNDAKTVYIGQDQHISHMPHFNTLGYFPTGWAELKQKFPTTFCTYTGPHGSAARSLCTTGGSHSWQTVTGNREIMCALAPPYKPDPPFSGKLGSRNGANAGEYKFQKIRSEATSGNYDTIMVNECAKKKMKPLCDHPSYCKRDPKTVYIGQDQHMAYPPHRNQDSYFPSGWPELKKQFPAEFCAYTGPHGSHANTLCTSGNSHAWQNIQNSNRDIMCAIAPPYEPDAPFSGMLQGRNGQNTGVYKFQRLRVQSKTGNYDNTYVVECNKQGMKPLCDHPSYCRNDPKTVYIGQDQHISHMPHFNTVSYFPNGWAELKGKFPSTFCTYTAQHGSSDKHLCTTGGSHSWQTIEGNNEIICAVAPPYKPDPPFFGKLGSKNGANAGEYKFWRLRVDPQSGNYDTIMVNECAKKKNETIVRSPFIL